jgi:hypothetical protein
MAKASPALMREIISEWPTLAISRKAHHDYYSDGARSTHIIPLLAVDEEAAGIEGMAVYYDEFYWVALFAASMLPMLPFSSFLIRYARCRGQ